MKRISSANVFRISFSLAITILLLALQSATGRILDNFNDNVKTTWSDFTFIPALGPSKEVNQQLQFELPPAGQSLFIANQKTSETFELKEGRTVEYRVDVAQTGGKDSFAILAFIPNTGGNSPGTLAGYGFAKSTTDVLITKGINKYFVAEGWPSGLPNDNITLVLTLTGKNGNVIINTKVLDKAQNNAVVWEKTVVDTPAADVLVAGSDSPAAPFLTTGYYTLYLYEDFAANAPENPYLVYYDNAEVYVQDTTVLDDFNDNTKTSWSDFTFIPALGPSKEVNQQLQFELPPAGQSLFIASQKISRTVELKDGDRVDLSVDVAQTGGKDSFAILAFIPNTGGNSPGTLAGYGLAKSTTDILITKGINKYFVAEGWPGGLPNDNITLALTLTGKDGSVIITAKVLDKTNSNAVVWKKTVVDTPAADVLVAGSDSPAAPFFTTGYFTLYLYEDFAANAPENPYLVYFDNAIVSAPPLAANTAPIISDPQPAEFANFVPALAQVSFKVTDDKALADNKLSITLNGTKFTTANGLTVTGTSDTKTAAVGGLLANVNYTAVFSAEDSEAVAVSRTIYFDAFAVNSLVVEIEDFNFGGGSFFDNPVPIAEGSGPQASFFSQQTGVPEVDFNDSRTTPRAQDTLYRSSDSVRMAHSLDKPRQKFTAAGGPDAGIYDYDVGDITAGEWLNYTRTFQPGSYEVYLREALANMATAESVLELVTGDRTQPNQTTTVLGSFLGERTGFQLRNFPLTDGSGLNKVIVRLLGVSTVRLRQVTADSPDGGRLLNYLIFNPVADPGLQRATISALSPAPNSETETLAPTITASIQNRDTTVKTNSILLSLNGTFVPATITGNASGATVSYAISPLPPSGTTNTARIVFTDNFNVSQTNNWNFVITYKSLDPANRSSGPGGERGFNLRMVQGDPNDPLLPHDNSLTQGEDLLAGRYLMVMNTNTTIQVVNQSKKLDDNSGFFPTDNVIPGLFDDQANPFGNGEVDFAVEIKAWLDLPVGIYRFGVLSDDGYKTSAGASPSDKEPVLAYHNDGPANEGNGGLVDFAVPAAGLYPFRLMWYERQGAAYAEWYSVNVATGERTLINDPNTATAIKAYRTIFLPAIVLESAARLIGGFAADNSASVNPSTKTVTTVRSSDARFYRLKSATSLKISNIRFDGNNVVLTYQ